MVTSKKAVVNPKNKKDNYCFVYATTIAIYRKEIGKHRDRISNKLLDYTEKLNWNGTDFPVSTSDYKKFQKLNEDVALNVFFILLMKKILKMILKLWMLNKNAFLIKVLQEKYK